MLLNKIIMIWIVNKFTFVDMIWFWIIFWKFVTLQPSHKMFLHPKSCSPILRCKRTENKLNFLMQHHHNLSSQHIYTLQNYPLESRSQVELRLVSKLAYINATNVFNVVAPIYFSNIYLQNWMFIRIPRLGRIIFTVWLW